MGMDYIGPWTFSAARLILGFLALLPFFFIFEFKKIKETKLNYKFVGGYIFFLGFLLAGGNILQQISLIYTDVAKDVQDIIAGGPVPTHIKPIWPFIAFTAFNTLPKEFKQLYGIKETKLKSIILEFNLKFLKYSRPFLPPFFRLIAPARWAKQRLVRNPNLKFKDKANF